MSVTTEHTSPNTSREMPVRAVGVRAAAEGCGVHELRLREGAVLLSWQFAWNVAAADAAALLKAVCRSGVARVVLVGAPARVVRGFCTVAGHVSFDVEITDRMPACWWLAGVNA